MPPSVPSGDVAKGGILWGQEAQDAPRAWTDGEDQAGGVLKFWGFPHNGALIYGDGDCLYSANIWIIYIYIYIYMYMINNYAANIWLTSMRLIYG